MTALSLALTLLSVFCIFSGLCDLLDYIIGRMGR